MFENSKGTWGSPQTPSSSSSKGISVLPVLSLTTNLASFAFIQDTHLHSSQPVLPSRGSIFIALYRLLGRLRTLLSFCSHNSWVGLTLFQDLLFFFFFLSFFLPSFLPPSLLSFLWY
jgi:hypothetical protein